MTSIFRYSKNYGSLTHETRIKDAVNMEDLICLLATVRTLKCRTTDSDELKVKVASLLDDSIDVIQRILL